MCSSQFYNLKHRTLIKVSGPDASKFLQNLVTNDVGDAGPSLLYSALLTAQGKYLFDFFIIKTAEDFLIIDICSKSSDAFLLRLKMYKLRSNVTLEPVEGTAVSYTHLTLPTILLV